MIRFVILLAILAGLGWFLDREQQAGRFQKADHGFLDFLLANARDRFTPAVPTSSSEVVFVRMREEDRIDYSAWPPQPIDWQMILRNLAAFDPEVVVISTPLAWAEPKPEFIPAVAEALIPFPSAVLGVLAGGDEQNAPGISGAAGLFGDAFPRISQLDGDANLLRSVGALTAAPDAAIRSQMELGLVSMPAAPRHGETTVSIPLAMRHGDAVVPSLVLQALARYSRAPYAHQRLRLGRGAGAHLGRGIFVPLTANGEVAVATTVPVSSVNALDLMTGTLAQALSAADKDRLGRNKIVVIGIDNDKLEPTLDRLQAQALAQMLSLPRIQMTGRTNRWIVSGVAALAGLALLRTRRSRALRGGLLLIFAGLVVSFVLFQSSLIWCPPTVPATLIAVSTVFAMIFGRRTRRSTRP